MNIIKVNVCFEKRIIYKAGVDITSGDYNSTKLVFDFDKQDGRKIFEMKSPNGDLVLVTDIVDNEVELVGKNENGNNASLFKESGKYIFEISLYDGDSKLTSAFNYINVKQEQIEVDGEVITPYLPIFDNLVNDVENIKNIIKSGGIGEGAITDVLVDGVSVVTDSVANINLSNLDNVLREILDAIQEGGTTSSTIEEIEQIIVAYLENKTVEEVEA